MLKITRSVTNILLAGAAAAYVPAAFGQSIFTAVPTPNENFDNGLLAASADSPTDIWAVGQSAIHYDGTQWTAFPVPMIDGNNTSSLGGVVAVSPSEAWAVGLLNSSGNVPPNQVIERWDGTQWNLYPNPTFPAEAVPNLYTMTAVSANDIWAVGSLLQSAETLNLLFEHWDGTSWTFSKIQTNNSFLMGSSSDATNDVWAVGYSGDLAESSDTLVYHYNGTAWQKMASPKAGAADQLSAVAALAPNDVWAVGNYYKALHDPQLTLIEHYDGSSWTVVPSPNVGPNSNFQSNRLFGITALSPTDI